MKVRDVVSQIRSSFKWLSSDDLASDRFIADELRKASILLIKQQTDKRRLYSSDNIFTEIPCLKMIQVPLAECCGYNSYPCMIARSEKKIPKLCEGIYGPVLQGAYSIDGKVRFDYMDADRFANYLNIYGDKGKDKLVFWKKNDYLYVNSPDIQLVKLIAFFEEDVQPEMLNCDSDEECPINPLDQDFKCPAYLIKPTTDMVREIILKTYKTSVEDKTEDDNATST